jgi:hypothetical protein
MSIGLSPMTCLCLVLAAFILLIISTIGAAVWVINYLNRLDISRCARKEAAKKSLPLSD